MGFLLQWVVSGAAIIVAACLLPGVAIEGLFAALVTTLIPARARAAMSGRAMGERKVDFAEWQLVEGYHAALR